MSDSCWAGQWVDNLDTRTAAKLVKKRVDVMAESLGSHLVALKVTNSAEKLAELMAAMLAEK